jgi:hypothetical protein
MRLPPHLPTRPHFGVCWLRRAFFLLGFLGVALAAPAAAQQYPPSEEALAISTSDASPGEPVTVAGDGFAAGSDVTITFESTPVVVGTARADATGRFTTQVRIPLDATPGMHTLRATGVDPAGHLRVLTTAIRVTGDLAEPTPARPLGGVAGDAPDAASHSSGRHSAASPASRSRGVAFTGSSIMVPVLVAAVALVAVGTLLVLAQTRRRRRTT